MEFDIEKVAKLALIDLSDEQKTAFAEQFPQILDYINQLQEVDTSGVEARPYLNDLHNVFREDEVQESSDVLKGALKEAFPKKVGDALKVPGVFSE